MCCSKLAAHWEMRLIVRSRTHSMSIMYAQNMRRSTTYQRMRIESIFLLYSYMVLQWHDLSWRLSLDTSKAVTDCSFICCDIWSLGKPFSSHSHLSPTIRWHTMRLENKADYHLPIIHFLLLIPFQKENNRKRFKGVIMYL